MLQRVRNEIHELSLVKNRTPDQHKVFNQLINAQQKLMSPSQTKSKASRANQNQLQVTVKHLLTISHLLSYNIYFFYYYYSV